MPKRKQNGTKARELEGKSPPETKKKKESNGKSHGHSDEVSSLDFSSPENFFSSFISPCSATEFMEQYWEKEPLHLSNRNALISAGDIFSREILENLVESRNIEFVRDICTSCYKNGERKNLDGHGRIKRAQLKKLMEKQNATIQLHQPQRFQESLWRMMELLETKFGCLFGANVYITPGGHQGLAPHHDDVEVFILQLEGQKQWHLYKPLQELPRTYSKDLSIDEIGNPTHSLILKPGDLLYFPRGVIHQAQAVDKFSHSTHITFSTYQHHTFSDYLLSGLPKMLGSAYDSDISFRRGLPVGFLAGSKLDMNTSSTLKDLLYNLSKRIVPTQEQVFQDMKLSFIANRLPPYQAQETVQEMNIRPEGSRITHMRLKYPGHTCVVVAGPPNQTIFCETKHNEEEDEDAESDEEDSDDDDEESEDGYNGNQKEDVFHVYNSISNNRRIHMMVQAETKPVAHVFPMRLLETFRRLEEAAGEWVSVKNLNVEDDEMLLGELVECKYCR
ncbi:ribosomal oxygenase 2-like [Apostichopus japonicus]|uniref:ribosomal oxygenase 2-like n=1 Tax=Stichopus japonicus TaxID=307972 RepID=UPI003AB20995